MRNLSPLAEFVLVVACLSLGKPVLAPICLAIYIAFVLTPPSDGLERIGFPRGVTVALMFGAALSLFVFVGAVLASQIVDLASQVHTYTAQMQLKLDLFRGTKGGTLDTLTSALQQLSRVFDSPMPRAETGNPVRVIPPPVNAIQRLHDVAAPLLEPLTAFAVVLTLAVFVLAQREDLRGRLIQLVGPQNVTLTTRTLDEAVQRISRLLMGLTYINAAYGVIVALGLMLIGIPYALLWGAIAGVLRFVPFVGTWIALALPTFVAFATTPGWFATDATVAMFAVVDLAAANIVEPVLLGHRTGVSSLALLVSVVFWTWLWGPLGLVLATPLTVCAAVMGRHVPRLAFLTVMLGDDPGLPPDVNFYQRVLARDFFDALRLARRTVQRSSLSAALDRLVVPALRFIARDNDSGAINDATAVALVRNIDDIARRLRPSPNRRGPPNELPKPVVVGVAANGETDSVLVEILGQAVAGQVSIEPLMSSPREQMAEVLIKRQPAVVCIAATPPGSPLNARYLCRRLRTGSAQTKIVVLLPAGDHDKSAEAAARLREAGATAVVFDLTSAQTTLAGLFATADATQ